MEFRWQVTPKMPSKKPFWFLVIFLALLFFYALFSKSYFLVFLTLLLYVALFWVYFFPQKSYEVFLDEKKIIFKGKENPLSEFNSFSVISFFNQPFLKFFSNSKFKKPLEIPLPEDRKKIEEIEKFLSKFLKPRKASISFLDFLIKNLGF